MFDEEACDILREFVNLKCRLMPYLYGQAVRSHKEGRPVLRPMFMDFPEDRACDTLDRQYMFGDSLLRSLKRTVKCSIICRREPGII